MKVVFRNYSNSHNNFFGEGRRVNVKWEQKYVCSKLLSMIERNIFIENLYDFQTRRGKCVLLFGGSCVVSWDSEKKNVHSMLHNLTFWNYIYDINFLSLYKLMNDRVNQYLYVFHMFLLFSPLSKKV